MKCQHPAATTSWLGRRQAIKLVAGATLLTAGRPAWASEAIANYAMVGLGSQIIRLWPGPPPGATVKLPNFKIAEHSKDLARPDRTLTGIVDPAIVVFRPAKPNGAAVLLMPGGGYEFEAFDNEGTRQAAWLNANGITAFILVYRLPAEGWAKRSLVPLQDAQRAMRTIRSRAVSFGVDPKRIAVLGFSAGGHLAGSLLTRSSQKDYDPVDDIDALSAAPRMAGLIYPVISMEPGVTHAGSRAALIGAEAAPAETRAASVDRNVGSETPPAFIVHTNDDTIVPVVNAERMYAAMRRENRTVALHIFDRGGHGFGVNHPVSEPVSVWPHLFLAFAREEGMY